VVGLRKTRYAVKQPELYPVIQYLESFVPRKELRELRREADEGEYSDWEYKEALENYWEEKIRQGIYCSDCGKRLSWKEVEDGVMFVGKPVCKKDLNRRMDW
jgi:formylmethanofuran dehydrogenase subunit E